MLYALDKEVAAKRERRVNKLLNTSRSPNLDACIEDITYTPGRNLNKEQITRLAHCQWCQKHKTLSSSANHPSEKPHSTDVAI
ncbi:ATP-binding protein [Corynebacterium riegelii]|uniref:ATP-binding protein n=1 Tax=Corynebacterium riegelii TaxID=156976 RepID=UPI002152F13F|nr:ATP-binding protein [Corynebacterium riegelii]